MATGVTTPTQGGAPAFGDSLPSPSPAAVPIARHEVLHATERGLNGLEQALFDDAGDGRLDHHTLLSATLIASGVAQGDRLGRYESRVSAWAGRLQSSGCDRGPAPRRAEEILRFLHREVFRGGYRLDGTDVAAAIDEGRFNCVTATVLFHCLAQQCGLTVRSLQTPGHTMCRVAGPEGSFDVETTAPEWRFAVQPIDTASRPHGPVRAAREVTEVELVATIYYNGGIELLRRRCFAEAICANAKALRLDPASLPARENYLATLNNWAIDLATEGRFADAAVLLERGLALEPTYGPLRINYERLHRVRTRDDNG